MKAFKVEILVVDHDELGPEGIKRIIEVTKYPNWCLSPHVKDIEERDIGEWTDEHPLNRAPECEEEYRRLFKEGNKS